MPGEYTLDDLVEDSGAASKAAESAGGGEWVEGLIEKLDKKGVLDALIENKLGSGENPGPAPGPAPEADPVPAPETDGGAVPEIDADGIKNVLLQVYDAGGTVPGLPEDPKVSDLIKLINKYPGMADRLISQHLGGE